MAPHATSPVRSESILRQIRDESSESPRHTANGQRTMVPQTQPDQLYDMICVGFGPASLAIATALHDSIESQQQGSYGTDVQMPKVAFLERQSSFRWHAGMQLPGATMQISWIKDLATLRNPRSSFTYLNYLWSVGRLLQFSNLGTLLPTRLEYEAYMKWAAGWFTELVEYSQECVEIIPSNHKTNGKIECREARHVVIACGGKPFIPSHFPQNSRRVVHTSSYAWTIPKTFLSRETPYSFVVIGSGQSAAETFHDLQSRFPNCRTTLLIRQAALKPSDDSPFVNEIFDPQRVDDLYETADDIRSNDILNDKPTNYGVVRLELLEAIYHDLYMQRVKHADPSDWQHRISPFREVTSIKDTGDKVRLFIENTEPLHRRGGNSMSHDVMDVDAVIVAAGYRRNAHEELLAPARHLIPENTKSDGRWAVRRDYSVVFKSDTVSTDAGIWLQGSNESTHGLSDTLLSILAIRGQEIVDSIFNPRQPKA